MNSRFAKYLKELSGNNPAAQKAALAELQRSFASLSQQDQGYAELLLNDFLRGEVAIQADFTFQDYLASYQAKADLAQIKTLVENLGVDEQLLLNFKQSKVTPDDINEYGRFDALINSLDKNKARQYFEVQEQAPVKPFQVNLLAHQLLEDFVLQK